MLHAGFTLEVLTSCTQILEVPLEIITKSLLSVILENPFIGRYVQV